MDYIIQEPVQKLLMWGVEGVHHIAEDGRLVRNPEMRDAQQDPQWIKDNMGKQLYDIMPKMQGSYADGNATEPNQQPEEYFAGLREYDRELFAKLGIKTQGGFIGTPKARPSYYPVWSMTIKDGSPAQLANQRAEDLRRVYYPKLVITDPADFDAIWDEYVAEFANTNFDAFLEEVNRQIVERKAVRGQ